MAIIRRLTELLGRGGGSRHDGDRKRESARKKRRESFEAQLGVTTLEDRILLSSTGLLPDDPNYSGGDQGSTSFQNSEPVSQPAASGWANDPNVAFYWEDPATFSDAFSQWLTANPLVPGADPILAVLAPFGNGVYHGLRLDIPVGVNLIIDGSAGGVNFVGASPALTVSGTLTLTGGTYQVSTDDPTILVQSGGALTLNGVTVLESDLFNRAAILVEAGGSLDLSAGNNVISTRGAGQLLVWNSSNALSIASGNQLQQDGVSIGVGTRAQGFATEDRITHALDVGTSGLVTWEPGSLYVTASSGSLARAVAVAPAASTIHVAAGTFVHDGQLNIDRSMTIIGEGQDQTIIKRAAQVTVGTEDRTVQVNVADVTFRSLTFGGWNQATTTANLGAGYLVWLNTAADRTTFDDIRFDGDDIRVGIYLHQRSDFTLTDSRFTGTYFRSAIRGAGERMLISRNTFEESHYKWGPIYMEYGAPTSGEISFNYFVSGIGVKNTALGSFDAAGEEFWSIANYQPHMTTAAGLRIVHNTFHFDESGEVNQTGNQVVPQGVFIDPNSVRSGPITIQDNIFEGYDYTGPQPTAGPLWRPGQGVFGGALELTGSGQFGEFKSPTINLGDKGTYALWVNLDVNNKRHMLAGGAVEFQINGTRAYFYPGTQTTTLVQTNTGLIPANAWTHLAFTWDKSTNSGKIFINGAEAPLSNTISSWTTIRDTVDKVIYIGRDPGNPISRDFDGKMDDVAFFDQALSAVDINQIRTQGVASLAGDPRLLAHWDFDQASGDVAVDNVRGIEMFITTDGIAHYQPAGPVFRTDQGKFGGALAFDGVDDFATFRDSSFDVGERGTLNFWVYSTNTSKRNQFFEGPGNAGFEVQYRTTSSGQVYARTATAPADFVIRSGGDAARLSSKWTNIQVTWDFNGLPVADGGGKMRIYLDGVESGYLAGSTPTDLNWTGIVDTVDGLMNVGRDPEDNTRFFAGMMDDIAWFDGVLTAAERTDIRDGGVGTSALIGDARLVAFWDLDDAVGTQIASGDGGTNISLYLQAAAPPAAPPMKQGYAINAVTGTVVSNNVFFGNDVDYTSRVDDRGDNLFGDPNFNLTTDATQHPYQVGFGGRATNWSSEYIADAFTSTPHVGAYQGLPGLFGGGDLWINGTGRDDTLEIVVTGPDAATARYTRDVGGPNEVVLDGIRLTSITGIHFLGKEGDDRFLLTQPTGGIFTPQDGIVFHGGTEDATLAGNPPPGDHFEMIGGATTSLKYAFGVAGSGAILTSTPGYQYVRFSSVETLADGMTVDSREFVFPVATTKVVLGDDPGRADSLLLTQELGASLGTAVTFRNPTALLTLTTDAASAATIEIDSLDPAFDADLTLATNVGDTVRFVGTLDLQGDLVVANADTITVTTGHAITTVGDGKIDFNAANQIVVDAGITTGGGDVELTVAPTGSIRLGAPLASATGDLLITGDVTLTADVQIATGGGTIRVDGTIDGAKTLDLQAGTGSIDLLDSIGAATPLIGLTAAAASVRFAGSQARVNDPLTNGFIRIFGDLVLANDVTLISDGLILLDGNITSETSARRLTLSAGETVTTTGDVNVKSVVVDAVGDVDFEGAVTASEYVRIRSDSAVTFDQSIQADELRIVANGDVAIAGDVNADSSTTLQSLTGSVRLASDLTSDVIDIDAKTTIDVDGSVSSVSLDLFAEGNITLTGAVSASTLAKIDSRADVVLGSNLTSATVDIDALGKVDVAGAIDSTTITIDSGTTVDVGGAISTTDLTINAGGNVTLDGAVNGTRSVVIDSAANVVIKSTLGTAAVDIDADGLIQITGPVNATTLDLLAVGNITITGAVTATTSAKVNSQADVVLGSSLTSPLVDIDAVGKVDIAGAVSSTTITIDSGTTVDVGGAISTSTLAINSGGTVTLSGAVNGTTSVVIDSAANVVIKSTLGTAAVDIDADGLIQITGPVIATTLDLLAVGNITITGAVTATTSAKIDSDAAVSLDPSLTSPLIDIDAGTTVNVVGKIDSATLDIFAIGTVTLTGAVDATTSAKINSQSDVVLGSSLTSPLVDIDAVGKVDITGAVNSTTITIDSGTTVDVGGAISTSTLAINSGGTVTLSGAVDGTSSVVIDSAANVVIKSTLGTAAVDIDADGLIQITGPVNATTLDLLAVGNITITGAVTATTSAKINSQSDVILGSSLTSPLIDIDAVGKVDIAGAVNSTTITIDSGTTVDVGGAISTSTLAINSGGNVTLSGAVNGTTSVVIDSAANVVINSTLGTAAVDIDADGLIQITGPVIATTLDLLAVGNITITGAVTATTSAKIDSDAAVSLDSSLTSPLIDIDAGTTVNVVGKIDSATLDVFAIGTVTFSGAVDATTSAKINSQSDVILGSNLTSPLVDIDAVGKVDITGAVNSTTITIDSGTTVDVGGAISTSTLAINSGGNVTLSGAVDGTSSVVIDSAANVVIKSTLGTAAVDIDADGLIQITGPVNATTLDLLAVGNITITGAVTATTSAKINSQSDVVLGSSLTSPLVDIDAVGKVDIAGAVNSTTITIDSGTTVDVGGAISTSTLAINSGGTVTLSGAVDGTTSVVIDSAANVVIKSTLGTAAVDIDADGLIQITGPVNATTLDLLAVGNITITGAVTATTSAKIDSDATVSLDSSLTSPLIDIDAGTTVNVVGKIDSATLDVFAIGTVTLTGAVDATTSVTINSQSDVILGSSLTSPLVDIDAVGKVDIAGAVSSTTITIDSGTTVDIAGAISTSTLAINSGGTVTLSGAVDGTTSVVIDSAANVVIKSTLGTAAVDIDADGLIQITGPVNATTLDLLAVGNITITGAVTATTSAKINSQSDVILGSSLTSPLVDIDSLGKVSIAGVLTSTTITIDAVRTVDVGGSITSDTVAINAGGNVTLVGAVSGATSVLIDSGASVVIGSTLSGATVAVDAGGAVSVTGAIATTAGSIGAGGPVHLIGAVDASTFAVVATANVAIDGDVTATTSLDIDSGGAVVIGKTVSGGAVGIEATQGVTLRGGVSSDRLVVAAGGDVTFQSPVHGTDGISVMGKDFVFGRLSTVSGDLELIAKGTVHLQGDIEVGTGTILVETDNLAGVSGAVVQSPGVTMKTGNGGADAVTVIAAQGGVTVSKIETGSGGTITIDARGGSVVGRSPAPNLVSSTAVVSAGTGIDLQTEIAALRAETIQGNIRIREADDILLEQLFAKGTRTGAGPQISVASGGRISVKQGDAAAIQTSIGAVNNIPTKLRLGQADPDDVLVSGDPTQEVVGTIGGLETEGDFREFGSNFRFRVTWNDGVVSELNTPLSSLVTQTGGAGVPTLQAGDILVWKIDESNRSTLELVRPNWGANPPSGPIQVFVQRTYSLRHLNALSQPEVTAKFEVFNDAQIRLTDASGELLNQSPEIAITTAVSKELLRPSTVVVVTEPQFVVTEVKPVTVLQVTPPPQQQIVIYNQASLAGETDQSSVPHLYLVLLSVDGKESERVEIAIDELRDLAALLERLKNSAIPNGLYRIDYQDPGLPPQRVLEFRKAGEAIGDPVREPGIGSNPLEGAAGDGGEAEGAAENGEGDPGVGSGAMRDPQGGPGKEVGSTSAFRGSADYTQGAWSTVARQVRKWNARDGA